MKATLTTVLLATAILVPYDTPVDATTVTSTAEDAQVVEQWCCGRQVEPVQLPVCAPEGCGGRLTVWRRR